jgi:hypothetical protein
VRDVDEGEEITIYYLGVHKNREAHYFVMCFTILLYVLLLCYAFHYSVLCFITLLYVLFI